jgi:hypothetical protein
VVATRRGEPERLEDVYLNYLEGNAAPMKTWSDGGGKAKNGASGADNTAICKVGQSGALVKPAPGDEDASPIARHFRLHRTWWGCTS